MQNKGWLKFLIIALIIIVLCAISPFVGISLITPSRLESDPLSKTIFFSLRIPRAITAFLAGGGLAIAGMVFQAVFRNPLATPFTLGIASGASCGAAACILFGVSAIIPFLPATSVGAFVGAIITLTMIYGFSSLKRDTSSMTMILAGIAISFIFSSLLMFMQYFSDSRHSFQIVRWLMGGIEVYGYNHLAIMSPLIAVGLIPVFLLLPHLDHLATGEDLAQSRGVDVKKIRNLLLIASSLIVAAIVAVCGPIGFIGMMVPHFCRLLVGPSHRILGPASFFLGAGYLVACDTIARIVVAPAEMPVGVITALMGGPFFLWLLFKKSREYFI